MSVFPLKNEKSTSGENTGDVTVDNIYYGFRVLWLQFGTFCTAEKKEMH